MDLRISRFESERPCLAPVEPDKVAEIEAQWTQVQDKEENYEHKHLPR